MKETALERITREMLKVRDFLELLSISKKQNVKLLDMLHKINDEQQDLLHEFELKKFYFNEGAQKAKELQKMRQVRRAVKDTLDLWRPLKEFANNHSKFRDELEAALKEMQEMRPLKELISKYPELQEELENTMMKIQEVAQAQTGRVYHSRIKSDSKINGKHYEAARVDMEQLLEA